MATTNNRKPQSASGSDPDTQSLAAGPQSSLVSAISDEPPPPTTAVGRAIGHGLVVLQFGLMACLGWLGIPALPQGHLTGSMAYLLIGLGGLVGLAALVANPPGNFNIHPAPRPNGQLITHGIYGWVRHPMYTALLLAGLGVSWAANSWVSRLVWLALLIVLMRKAWLEEEWLEQVHPDYAAYRNRTHHFLPGCY